MRPSIGPDSATRPRCSTATWSHRSWISCRLWLHSTTVRSPRIERISSRVWRAFSGSSPAVGSSRKSSSGSPMSAWARAARLRMPWLSARGSRAAASPSRTASSARAAALRASPRPRPESRPKSVSCAPTATPPWKSASCGSIATRPRRLRKSVAAVPSTRASPPSGWRKPPATESRVVLPAPFGPSSPNRLPRGTRSETSSRAASGPKCLLTPSSSRAVLTGLASRTARPRRRRAAR